MVTVTLDTQNSNSFLQNQAKFPDWETVKTELTSVNPGFLDLQTARKSLAEIQKFVTEIQFEFEHILLVGIGGSMLGPETIIKTLGNSEQKAKVKFLDNIDPDLLFEILNQLNIAKTLFIFQSKSGNTPETVSQYLFIQQKLKSLNLDFASRVIVVTDGQAGFLRTQVQDLRLVSFEIPRNLGGRFSVLSPVGFLAAELVGISCEPILSGAETCLQENLAGNSSQAYNQAVVHKSLADFGKTNLVLMPYSSNLQTFNRWLVQLISESLGKQKTLASGELVGVGLTPILATGVTDQHSQLQLFQEGPEDKQILFLEIEDFKQDFEITKQVFSAENEDLKIFEGRTFAELLRAELEGTKSSLTLSKKPNLSLKISSISEFSLGYLFFHFELVVASLGILMEINTYDQPGVEQSKILTKEILKSYAKNSV